AASKFSEHVAGLLARGGVQIGVERAQLYAMLRRERDQRLDVEPLHLGQRKGRLRRAGVRDDGFEFGVERLPDFQRHDAFAGAVRLVEPWTIIERRDAVEPERNVGAGTDELGAVDHARL